MAGGHDQLFKDLLRAFPADFLWLAGEAVAAKLELGGLELQPAEVFLDQPRGDQRRLDLVTRAEARTGGAGPVLLHVEIELRYRSTVAARLWLYNCLLHQRHGLPVHTFVLWLHGGPPGASAGIHRQESLGEELHRFHFRGLGLSRALAAPLLARPEPLAWALAALALPAAGDRRGLRRACLGRIAAAPDLDEARRFLLFNCVATYLELDGGAAAEFAALLAEHQGTEDRTMMTWEEKVEARGVEKGKSEGKREGMRTLLLRQLRQRFAPLPEAATERVAAITSMDELTRLADRVLTARSLEDLGLA
jgi:hypothetical protein